MEIEAAVRSPTRRRVSGGRTITQARAHVLFGMAGYTDLDSRCIPRRAEAWATEAYLGVRRVRTG